MIEVVLFDLDDTLYYEKQFCLSGLNTVSKYVSREISINWNKTYYDLIELLKNSRKYVFNRLCNKYKLDEKSYLNKMIEIYRFHDPNITLKKGVKCILNDLEKTGFSMGIITDGYRITQWKKIDALGISSLMEFIHINDEYHKDEWKPCSISFKKALDFFNVQPDSMLYIGDNWEKDFLGAKELNIITVGIKDKDNLNYEKIKRNRVQPDYVIEDLSELYSVIKNI